MMNLLNRPYGISFLILFLFGSLALSPKLQAQDFRPECGRVPSDVFLMLDRTNSVSDEERAKEAEAAKTLVRLLLEQTENRVAIGAFGSEICQADYPASILEGLSNQEDDLFSAIDMGMANSSCGGTNLSDPVRLAGEVLDQGQNPNRVFILISDGDANFPREQPGPRQLALAAADNLKDEGVRIFTIAFDAAQTHDELNRGTMADMASNASQDDSQGEVDPEEQAQENQDEDDFFIAPQAQDLERVFKNIGEMILCDDQDPCTEDRCGTDRRCEYVIKDACRGAPEASETCEVESCPSKDFLDKDEATEPPLAQSPELPSSGAIGMVQGGGMACALGYSKAIQDLGDMLLGIIGLMGGLLLLRRSE